jgi:hypothetical protein
MSNAVKKANATAPIAAENIFVPGFDYSVIAGQLDATVDFAEVEYITSESLREMITWLTSVSTLYPILPIIFTNVPSVVYRQLLMFNSALPSELVVASLTIPFFCDDCSEDGAKFYTSDQLLSKRTPAEALPPYPICPACKKDMEPDINFENFFSRVGRVPKK